MSTATTTASIVICTLNRPDDIQRCVATITRQTRLPQQLIVVDAGDLGAVADRLRELCAAAGIRYHYEKDAPSTTRQRNKGAEHVTSDVVFFMDDDAELDENYLSRILHEYDTDLAGTLGGATGVLLPEQEAARGFWSWYSRLFCLAETRAGVGSRMKRSNFPIHSTGLSDVTPCELLPSTAVSYRTSVFRKHRFDGDLTGYVMAEDLDLSLRISRQYRLVTVPKAVFRHSKSPVSRNPSRETERRRILFTQYFFRKNLGSSAFNWIARYWALIGMALRYGWLGIRHGRTDAFRGLVDGLRSAARNRILWPGRFRPGPLDV